MITIDGVECPKTGRLVCIQGSGDSKEEWGFDILEPPTGERYLMNTDDGQSWLYRLCTEEDPCLEVETTHETSVVDTISGDLTPRQKKSRKDLEFSWVGFKERFENAPAPFKDTKQGMTLARQGKSPSETYMSIPLLRRGRDTYYTPHFPANDLPQEEVEAFQRPRASSMLEGVAGVGTILALIWGVVSINPTPLTLVWWLGPILGICYLFSSRSGLFYDSMRLLVGAYLLHFSTHVIDTTVASEYWGEPAAIAFESTRFAIVLFLLLVLRVTSLRLYSTLVDGSFYGGGCAWWVFAGGLALWGMFEEFNSFEWFRWYSGTLPWGGIWAVILCIGLAERWRDYRNVPLDRRRMRKSLNQLFQSCSQDLQTLVNQGAEISDVCDNLEDAVRVSNDPSVLAQLRLGPSFLALKKAFDTLKELDIDNLSPRETERIQEDLALAAKDIEVILANFRDWGKDDCSFKAPRVSPFLLTYGK